MEFCSSISLCKVPSSNEKYVQSSFFLSNIPVQSRDVTSPEHLLHCYIRVCQCASVCHGLIVFTESHYTTLHLVTTVTPCPYRATTVSTVKQCIYKPNKFTTVIINNYSATTVTMFEQCIYKATTFVRVICI